MRYFIFFISIVIWHNNFAQQYDNCLIYEIILSHLNGKYNQIRYAYSGGIDTKEFNFKKEELKKKQIGKYFIVNKTEPLPENFIEKWVVKMFNDSSFNINKVEGDNFKKKIITQCQFNSTIQYQFCDFFSGTK